MKFLNYIQEEYCDLYKSYGLNNGVEIYENPDASDLKYLTDLELRYTAVNDTKKLFVWDAMTCNHNDMVSYLELRKHMKKHTGNVATDPNLFNGHATVSGNKLKMGASDDFTFYTPRNLLSRLEKNWDWLKTYFTDISYIVVLRKKAAHANLLSPPDN